MFEAKALIRASVMAALLPSAAAMAAAADTAGTLDEIIVTAQKRSEAIQSVPVSITLVNAEQLARSGVNTLSDLARTSASVEFGAPGTSSPGGGAYVRGLGTNSFGYTAQASVGIVLDGVVMGNAHILSLFDIDRVEVLKGPQGTMFGNSVSAGVINISTKAPDPTKKSVTVNTEFGADALGSDYARYMLRTVANLPMSDTSALRIAAHAETNQGVFHDVYSNRDSSDVDTGVRVRYLSRPSDNLTINLIADYNKQKVDDSPPLTYRAVLPNTGLANALAACGVKASTENFTNCSQIFNTDRFITKGLSAQFDVGLGNDMTLTSISSYRGRNTAGRGDIMTIPVDITKVQMAAFSKCAPPAGPPPWPAGFDITCLGLYAILPGGINGLQTHDKKQYSEELRIASGLNRSFEWVAGVFYQDYKDDAAEPGLINAFFTGGNYAPTGNTAAVKTKDYAGFANGTYYFSPSWRGIVGLRYTHSTVSENKTDPGNGITNAHLSTDASKVSYRVGTQFDVAPHTMLYATLSTGYKGPQISDSFDNGGHMYGVNPEVPTNYELGIKASAFDDRLALNADVFYTKVTGYQGQQCSQINSGPNAGTIACVPTNISGVKSKGVEIDIFGRPVAGLTLNVSGIYNPAEYPNHYLAADGTDLGGTQLTRASKTKLTFSGEYAHPMTDSLEFVIGGDATYRGKQSIYPSAQTQFIVDSGTIYNARIGIKSSENWDVYLFGRNLGNEHFPRDLFPTPFQGGGLWQAFDAGDRKIVGLQVNATF